MKNLPLIAIIALLPFGFNLSAETEGPHPGATETKPKVEKRVSPEYPTDALILGAQGTVNVELLVSPAGDVLAAGSMDKTTHPALTKAALAAIQKWKFESRETSTDQPYMVRVPVNFSIADEGRPLATAVAAK